jgi:2-iminobutanoate/2-iminopropanoate deaminase
MRLVPLWLLGSALAAACQKPVAEAHYIPLGGRADLPFSAAVRVGPMLYLSGQLGTDSAARIVPGGVAAETRQALENIKRLLEANGSSLDGVVKCTVMLADIREWGDMNQVYVTYFPRHRPARSAFGTSGLALGGRVEIECMATAGS